MTDGGAGMCGFGDGVVLLTGGEVPGCLLSAR